MADTRGRPAVVSVDARGDSSRPEAIEAVVVWARRAATHAHARVVPRGQSYAFPPTDDSGVPGISGMHIRWGETVLVAHRLAGAVTETRTQGST